MPIKKEGLKNTKITIKLIWESMKEVLYKMSTFLKIRIKEQFMEKECQPVRKSASNLQEILEYKTLIGTSRIPMLIMNILVLHLKFLLLLPKIGGQLYQINRTVAQQIWGFLKKNSMLTISQLNWTVSLRCMIKEVE